MPTSIPLAVGAGLILNVPDGVALIKGADIQGPQTAAPAHPQVTGGQETIRLTQDARPAPSDVVQQGLVRAAVKPLAELAKDKRRAVIVAGDLSLPAPYEYLLPAIVQELVKADIRPSRISFLIAPGNGYPVLGRGAIHRYGEEIVGDHELRAMVENDPSFEAADLRIVIAPDMPGQEHLPITGAHAVVSLGLGAGKQLEITAAECLAPGNVSNRRTWKTSSEAHDVLLLSGGGSPWEETFEEALLSLHAALPPAADAAEKTRTLVLAFSGSEGIGSAHFALDFYSLLEQAQEFIAGGGVLPPTPRGKVYDPAGAFADALARFGRIVLLSRTFSEHSEGEELVDRLAEWPSLSDRLALCPNEAALWTLLRALHGDNYRLRVEPLGWRGLIS